MAIESVLLNVRDIARSVEFYERLLDATVVKSTDDSAELDLVTARFLLTRVDAPADSTWVGDDLQRGFRHVGFKVSDLDDRVAALHEAEVPFHLEPIHAEGGVRITFFYDPDGTLLELVEGPLQYHEVYDREAVDQDWGLGEPDRPRFDHVAETVADIETTTAHFSSLGYVRMAGIHQPSDDRGFEITFLRSGDSSLEVFTYDKAEKQQRTPQLDALGFAAVTFGGTGTGTGTGAGGGGRGGATVAVGTLLGQDVLTDPDGLPYIVARA
ncbi:catechol 2,3-dioxygenase-like lactoylglutathione lyase family enzyme [Curtobacterium pusillum]|uniref:Catechol 2,3-dioxygenase-like lactoylglutathione lyase family enzyme n=1 Tax=Curtobacterium pusillum TaxID=69373 RepID=A0AAW3T470_9MICO|nr:catechol 2,3-dioxygenase-like lactoylglutathione lyase family enzyme [Curtobacterium pusillum]